jgi:radical SAM protein with 4Fe4S-binding SPASM domain
MTATSGFSVGLALTNECNLTCAHCYRDVHDMSRMTLDQVRAICESLPVRSINLGTGENGLHPQYREVLAYLRERGIKTTITTNGLSVDILTDDELRTFHSIEVSIDYPDEDEQDRFRAPGNYRQSLNVLDRCRRLGIPGTITAVMMSTNHDRLVPIARLAAEHGATFRVNVYQAVQTDAFSLSYAQFWAGFRLLFEHTVVIACTEPLVNAIMGLGGISGAGCGNGTVRITARGTVLPCVYWPSRGERLETLLEAGAAIGEARDWQMIHTLPAYCRTCAYVATCQGGCGSRRRLRGKLDEPDEYCPVVRGDAVVLDWARAVGRDLPKAGSSCTTIVAARVPASDATC